MDKKDFDLRLWSYVQSESTFFDLPIDKVTQLLKSDFLIDDGISKLKFMFPKITERELNYKYQLTKMKGFEAIIYKGEDERYLYKLINPKHKIYARGRFNVVVMFYILQDYLFPDFKYEDLKICEDKMFVRQRRTDSPLPDSLNQIRSYMVNDGYKFIDENQGCAVKIKDIIIIISDLTLNNCRINKSKLEVF